MKKITSLITICFLLVSSALAFDWSQVKGGAQGRVSYGTPVGTFFYGRAGESVDLLVWTSPTTLEVACGVGTIDNPEHLLSIKKISDTGMLSNIRCPSSTLYIAVCVYASGPYGTVLMGATQHGFINSMQSIPWSTQEEISPEVKNRLISALKTFAGKK